MTDLLLLALQYGLIVGVFLAALVLPVLVVVELFERGRRK